MNTSTPLDPAPAPEKKKPLGCWAMLFRLALIIAAVFVFESLLEWVFRAVFPADALTQSFIPFQNHYFSFTDAYITTEGVSEFSDDMSASGRFLWMGIIVFIGLIVTTVILYVIPFTRRLVDHVVYGLFVPALLLTMAWSHFMPDTLTTFNRDQKKMSITNHHHVFLGNTVEIPFKQITDFDYKVIEVRNYTDHMRNEYVAEFVKIYAIIPGDTLLIAENETGQHSMNKDEWKLSPERKEETVKLIEALRKMTNLE